MDYQTTKELCIAVDKNYQEVEPFATSEVLLLRMYKV